MTVDLILRISRLVLLALIILVTYLSLVPGPEMPLPGVWDKAKHFAAYAALGFWGTLSVRNQNAALWVTLGLIAYGFSLEAVQGLMPGRVAAVGDGLANAIGTIAGLISGLTIKRFFPRSWKAN